MAKPNTIMPLTFTAAFRAAAGGRFGVVTITTNKYMIMETDPAINPLFSAFLLTAELDMDFKFNQYFMMF